MPPDLSHARAKLKRAKEHVKDFYRLKTVFRDSYADKVIAQFNLEANKTVFRVNYIPVIDEDVAFFIGDAIHNFRCALDHLAFALFKQFNPTESGSHIYFPIGENSSDYESQSSRKTKGIPKTITDRIDLFKPYGGEALPNMLWPLHKLDIIDKHQLLITVATVNAGVMAQADGSRFAMQTLFLPASHKLISGDVIWEVSGNLENNKDLDFVFDIAFGEPEMVKEFSVGVAFGLIANQVETIIESFSR